jgi:rhodanese-related sulfurtransferase
MGNILDVRPAELFAQGHLKLAVNLPLPLLIGSDERSAAAILDDLLPSIFLPPRHEPMVVVAADAQLAGFVCAYLKERGRTEVHPCVLTPGDLAGLPTTAVAAGSTSRHLWRPPRFLAAHAHMLPSPQAGQVVDLGSGCCRAAVWLAERGYRVTAVDHQRDSLDLGHRLAESRSVQVQFLLRDLRDPQQVPLGPWAVALAFRYLERPLLRRLNQLLLPDGVAMVQTFRYVEGQPGLPARRHCLEPGELLGLFGAEAFRILVHEENDDEDGLPVAGMVVQRLP